MKAHPGSRLSSRATSGTHPDSGYIRALANCPLYFRNAAFAVVLEAPEDPIRDQDLSVLCTPNNDFE
ncbi:MAG: hypothetical protein ACR2PG_26055 [Hyphomicrobiaceae bacterium]